MKSRLLDLARSCTGTMVVEAALAAPVLAVMALGSYDVARLVQRQQEIQSTASEAEIIALATQSGATANAEKVQNILAASLGFDPATQDHVHVTGKYLCDGGTTPVDASTDCNPDPDASPAPAYIATPYFHVVVSDTYTPTWTQFGVGSAVNLGVDRWVLVPPAPAAS